MREIVQIEEIKKIQLDLMKAVHIFCQENKLTYYLWGGSLLGAIRHNGYIPWDDDIDIAMPRKDYEYFCSNFNIDTYKVVSCGRDDEYFLPYAKAYDSRTLKEEVVCYRGKKRYGIDVDIFPIDTVGSYENVEKTKAKRTKLIKKLIKSNYKFQKSTSALRTLVRAGRGILYTFERKLGLLNSNKIANELNKMATSFNGESKDQMSYADPWRKVPFYMPQDWVDNIILHKFEDTQFCIMEKYDQVLSAYFGDYMTLPPEEQRITHHNFKIFYKE